MAAEPALELAPALGPAHQSTGGGSGCGTSSLCSTSRTPTISAIGGNIADDAASSYNGSDGSTSRPRAANATEARQLLKAAGSGDIEQVLSILDSCSLGVNQLRARGSTSLHEATKGGHIVVVRELLARAAEVNAVNRSGCTALHFATLCKDPPQAKEIVELLVERSATVNATNERMDTPLHFAAYSQSALGSEDIIQCLVTKKARVNVRNRYQESPLISAALHDHAKAVKVLIENGADLNHQNSLCKTAADIAQERGCNEVLQVIEEMKDPLTQMKDIAQQMRTVLFQVQTVDALSGDLRQQTGLADALECGATSAFAELDTEAKLRITYRTLEDLKRSEGLKPRATLTHAKRPSPCQQQLTTVLVSLLLISKTLDGGQILHEAGLPEVLPLLEQLVAAADSGHKELRELRIALTRGQAEFRRHDGECSSMATTTAERSESSTPSSLNSFNMCGGRGVGLSGTTPSASFAASAYQPSTSTTGSYQQSVGHTLTRGSHGSSAQSSMKSITSAQSVGVVYSNGSGHAAALQCLAGGATGSTAAPPEHEAALGSQDEAGLSPTSRNGRRASFAPVKKANAGPERAMASSAPCLIVGHPPLFEEELSPGTRSEGWSFFKHTEGGSHVTSARHSTASLGSGLSHPKHAISGVFLRDVTPERLSELVSVSSCESSSFEKFDAISPTELPQKLATLPDARQKRWCSKTCAVL